MFTEEGKFSEDMITSWKNGKNIIKTVEHYLRYKLDDFISTPCELISVFLLQVSNMEEVISQLSSPDYFVNFDFTYRRYVKPCFDGRILDDDEKVLWEAAVGIINNQRRRDKGVERMLKDTKLTTEEIKAMKTRVTETRAPGRRNRRDDDPLSRSMAAQLSSTVETVRVHQQQVMNQQNQFAEEQKRQGEEQKRLGEVQKSQDIIQKNMLNDILVLKSQQRQPRLIEHANGSGSGSQQQSPQSSPHHVPTAKRSKPTRSSSSNGPRKKFREEKGKGKKKKENERDMFTFPTSSEEDDNVKEHEDFLEKDLGRK